jgi:hypothetical protein
VTGPRLTDREACELWALVAQASELREAGSPYYYPDACAAIATWIHRFTLGRWEQFQQAEADRRRKEAA